MAIDPTYFQTVAENLDKITSVLTNVGRVIDRATGNVVINGVTHFAPTEIQQIALANNVMIPMLTAALVKLNQTKNLSPELP